MAEHFQKCRLCGERHPLGACPAFRSKPAKVLAERVPLVKRGIGADEPINAEVLDSRLEGRDAMAIPKRKRESGAAKKAPKSAGAGGRSMKARASRVAGGRTPDKGRGRSAPAPTARKVGRPRIGEEKNTIAATKPWLKLKMSERTWWRRQAEGKA